MIKAKGPKRKYFFVFTPNIIADQYPIVKHKNNTYEYIYIILEVPASSVRTPQKKHV
jgi:hypothetical protein